MPDNRKLSALPLADGLTDEDMILVTQGGLSKRSTVGALQQGVLGAVAFQQEATESEAVAGNTSDTVMTAQRVKNATDYAKRLILPIEGREYLGAFHNALLAGDDPINVLISGDSTTRGYPYTDPPFVPQTLMSNLTRRMGVIGPVYTALGRSGKATDYWLSTALAEDMAYNPTLYIWHWGLNDPRANLENFTAEQTRENLRAGLELIREDHPLDEMSIIILTPNFSNTAANGRTREWFATVIEYMREAAQDYDCCFIDIYTPWKNADGTMMYTENSGEFVHPGNGYSLQSWSLVADTIFPAELRRPDAVVESDIVKRRHVAKGAWLSSNPGADNSWQGVCWSSDFGRFVAVGSAGAGNRVTTSENGETWTLRTSAADDNWRAVCYAPELGRLVAVANNGSGTRAMSSDDGGVTWTVRTSASSSAQWVSVCWSPDRRLFVAVGIAGVVMSSPDGITWTSRTPAASNNWQGVVWARRLGLFVAVGSSGAGNRVMTSYDGFTWSAQVSASDLAWVGTCYSEQLGLFVAVANMTGPSNIMTSPDGKTWTLRSGSNSNARFAVTYSEELGLFVTLGASGTGNRVMTSADGVTWVDGSAPDRNWRFACYSPELGLLCAVAADGTGDGVATSVSAHSFPYRG